MNKKESKPFFNENIRRLIKWATIPMLGAITLTGCGGSTKESSNSSSTGLTIPGPKPPAALGSPTKVPLSHLFNQCLDEPTTWSTHFAFPPAYTYSAGAQQDIDSFKAGAANINNSQFSNQQPSGAQKGVSFLGPGMQLLNGPMGEVVTTIPNGEMIEIDCPIASTGISGEVDAFQIKNSPNPSQWYWVNTLPGAINNRGTTGAGISEQWQNFEDNDLIKDAPNGDIAPGSGLINFENGEFYYDTQNYSGPKVQVGVGIMEQYNPIYWSNNPEE